VEGMNRKGGFHFSIYFIGIFSGSLNSKGDSWSQGYPPNDKEYMGKGEFFPLPDIFIGIFEKYFKCKFCLNSGHFLPNIAMQ
jgi:hypothetical protein